MAGQTIGLKAKLEPELDERQTDREVNSLDEKLSDAAEATIRGDISGAKQDIKQGLTEAVLDADLGGLLGDEVEEADFGLGDAMGTLENVGATRGLEQLPSQMGRAGVSTAGRGAATAAGASGGALSKVLGSGGKLLKVGLAGAVGYGILKGVEKMAAHSPKLSVATGMLKDAMSLVLRPFGRLIGSVLMPFTKSALQGAARLNEYAGEDGLLIGLPKWFTETLVNLPITLAENVGNALLNAGEDLLPYDDLPRLDLPKFRWDAFIETSLSWGAYINSKLTWSNFVDTLEWATWVPQVRWGDWIPDPGDLVSFWGPWIPGTSSVFGFWGNWVPSLSWSDFISGVNLSNWVTGGGGGGDDDGWFGFASGGLVTGETRAMIGEGTEAEAVQPLSHLEAMLDRERRAGAEAARGQPTRRTDADADDLLDALEAIKRELNRLDPDVELRTDGKTIAKTAQRNAEKYGTSRTVTR